MNFTVAFSNPVAANRLMLAFNDLAGTSGQVSITGGTAGTSDFVALPVDETGGTPPYAMKPALAWTPATGAVSRTAGQINHNVLLLLGQSEATLDSVTVSIIDPNPTPADFTNVGVGVVAPAMAIPTVSGWSHALLAAALLACGVARATSVLRSSPRDRRRLAALSG